MATKPSQILHIEPSNELQFKGPFTDVIITPLHLTNPSSKSVCFKVKTTAPKQYCVRPNSGIIPPNGSVQVSVMLQPFEMSASDTLERGKHKFMVQSVFVKDGETNLESIWKNTPAGEFMESKLRVHFDDPDKIAVDSVKLTQSQHQAPSQFGSTADTDYGRTLDENKRLQSRMHQEETENAKLRDRLRKLIEANQSAGGDGGSAQKLVSNITLMHILMAAFVALFLGIVIGKYI